VGGGAARAALEDFLAGDVASRLQLCARTLRVAAVASTAGPVDSGDEVHGPAATVASVTRTVERLLGEVEAFALRSRMLLAGTL